MPYRGSKKRPWFFFLLFLLTFPVHILPAYISPDEPEEKAAEFIANMNTANFGAAYAAFDSTVQTKIDVETLQQIWKSLAEKAGRFIKIRRLDKHEKDSFRIIIASCQFERTQIGLQFTFNSRAEIAGFFIVPAVSEEDFKAADYVDKNKFSSERVSIGKKPWLLPGVLTLPFTGRPAPALILIHGSGPQDSDESIGPNKPFRDLAEGLSTQGIAVLRYDKRTKVYAQAMAEIKNTLTVKGEIIDDVFAAIAFLIQKKEIDPQQIFLLGHSLGGTMIPRIAVRDSICAGFIIMAGATRRLEDLIVEQVSYLAGLDTVLSESEKNEIETLREQAARVKDTNLSKDTPSTLLPLGVDAAYWLDLRNYDPLAEAARIKRPILVLQGERDYQVTDTDLLGWRKALAYANDAQVISFQGLNHLFMKGTGKSSPDEYMQGGHVAAEVIKTIVNWIDSY